MDFASIAKNAIGLLLLPPGLGLTTVIFLGLGVLFLAKRSKKRTVVRWAFVLCLALSYALTTRSVGYQLALFVEGEDLRALSVDVFRESQQKGAGRPDTQTAIVVLGGGLKYDGREKPHTLNLNQRTALRVQHGAYLAKKLNLPVLVSGGVGVGFRESEAFVMARTFQEDYAVQVRWQEPHSVTTAENARFASLTLQAEGINKIILVTQAYHMRRSALAFQAQGIEVIMAPCGFLGGVDVETHLAWLPSFGGIEAAYLASHEMVGLLFYWLKGEIHSLSYRPASIRSSSQ
jgi:uncharacterized SAM-binding protein YcdF (DUF218 family)